MARRAKMCGADRTRKKWVLMWAQGAVCPDCSRLLRPDLPQHHDLYPTLDHVLSHSRGGANSYGNLLLKHRVCNEARADAWPSNRDKAALALVAERLKSRPATTAECKEAALAILAAGQMTRAA